MIEQLLGRYKISSDEDRYTALREVMQEIALAGLYRGGFFKKAAFYGGTALRVFYGLDRYSEDLDFSLLMHDDEFSLEPYFKDIIGEFGALGVEVKISKKEKTATTNIESAFLKNDTAIHLISFNTNLIAKTVKIKFEVDKNPPLDFSTEEKLLLQPFPFYVNCFTIESLYAGKIHALLFRGWAQRVKGRDWYDFEWYVRNNHKLDIAHLTKRAIASGDLPQDGSFTQESLKSLLVQKVSTLNIEQAKLDIRRFIKNERSLDIWSKEYFYKLIELMII